MAPGQDNNASQPIASLPNSQYGTDVQAMEKLGTPDGATTSNSTNNSTNTSKSTNLLPYLQGANAIAGLAGTIAALTKQQPLHSVETPRQQNYFPQSHEDLIMMLHRLASLGK